MEKKRDTKNLCHEMSMLCSIVVNFRKDSNELTDEGNIKDGEKRNISNLVSVSLRGSTSAIEFLDLNLSFVMFDLETTNNESVID